MITRNKIAKAYEAMKPEQLAAIAFQNVMKQDAVEFDRVRDAVPRRTYNSLDYDYRMRFSSLFDFADYWTIQRQRHVIDSLSLTIKLYQLTRELIAAKPGADEFITLSEQLDVLVERCSRQNAMLAAMDVAMATVCRELGIDAELIRTFAGFKPLPDGFAEPDADWLAEMTAICRAVALGDWPSDLVKGLHCPPQERRCEAANR